MKQYSISNEEHVITIDIEQIEEDKLKFKLIFKNNDIAFDMDEIATNLDPEGMAALKEFDPSGEDNAMEMYIYSTSEYYIMILIPLVDADIDYIGLSIRNSNDKYLFDGMLIHNDV
ncbi:MAG: hypothetical protein Kapaf2KO_10410 [Candidatus Kapaibacteriales bacterium]